MKKILLIFSILVYCLTSSAQTLSGPTTMVSGQEYLITVTGESSAKFVSYVNYPGTLNTTPNTFNGTVYINNDMITEYTSYYQLNAVPANKTTFKFKASSNFGSPMQVNFVFYVNYSLNNGASIQQQQQLSFSTTLNPIPAPPQQPTTYYSAAKSGNFTKNDCSTGNTGSVVAYSVPAGQYTSTTSQADADTKAQNDVNTKGQAYANANGTCNVTLASYTYTLSANQGFSTTYQWTDYTGVVRRQQINSGGSTTVCAQDGTVSGGPYTKGAICH